MLSTKSQELRLQKRCKDCLDVMPVLLQLLLAARQACRPDQETNVACVCRSLTICRAESALGAQGSLQRTARTDLHELQDVCMREGLHAADASLWLEH